MCATTAPPDHRTLRRALADASEHLRTLNLAGRDAVLTREVACAALAAVSVALLSDTDPVGGHLVAALVADDIERIMRLLGAAVVS